MSGDREWADRAKRFMKAELKRREVTYEELARRLGEMGVRETKASVASKLSRGGFTAAFLLASMRAIGCPAIRMDDV
jgi:3-mercaptopyruvate sulfurtransferase SseA